MGGGSSWASAEGTTSVSRDFLFDHLRSHFKPAFMLSIPGAPAPTPKNLEKQVIPLSPSPSPSPQATTQHAARLCLTTLRYRLLKSESRPIPSCSHPSKNGCNSATELSPPPTERKRPPSHSRKISSSSRPAITYRKRPHHVARSSCCSCASPGSLKIIVQIKHVSAISCAILTRLHLSRQTGGEHM